MTAWIKNWFSNMERLEKPFIVDGIEYPTVENFYAVSKTLNVQQKRKIAMLTPSVAQKYARTLALRPDWEEVKFAIMLIGLVQKFYPGTNWHKELMETRGEELLELNNWHDTVWGVPANIAPGGQGKAIPTGQQGNNWLGRLLMFIRDEPLLWQTIGNNAAEWERQKYLVETQELTVIRVCQFILKALVVIVLAGDRSFGAAIGNPILLGHSLDYRHPGLWSDRSPLPGSPVRRK